MPMKIEITTDSDSTKCECCGTSYAEGGEVRIDGKLVLSRPARAHCFDGSSFTEDELLVMALTKLGHEITVGGKQFVVSTHDEEYHGPLEPGKDTAVGKPRGRQKSPSMPTKIEITTDSDVSECDCCGSSYADGGEVHIDGELVLSRPASAGCFGGTHFDEGDLLVMALTKLGHEITVDGDKFFISTHDNEYHGPLEP